MPQRLYGKPLRPILGAKLQEPDQPLRNTSRMTLDLGFPKNETVNNIKDFTRNYGVQAHLDP